MLSQKHANILARTDEQASPWVTLVGKTVDFGFGSPQVYHCISQSDYVAILAIVPDGRIAIVRQFRPAVERYVWELPAGLLEEGETPEQCCTRELQEEVGVETLSLKSLGSYFPDTGRLENRMHTFLVAASMPDPNVEVEEGIEVRFVTKRELLDLVARGEFPHMLHLGVLAAAGMLGEWSHKE